MQPEILKNMKESINRMQGPVPELMKLNMKTIKNLSFIKPEEWSSLRNPQDIFDKSMKVFVHNGHKMLEYFQEATEILEKNWLSTSNQAMKNMKQGMEQSQEAMSKTMRNARHAASNLKGKQNELWKKTH
jgi:gas vesicle protein